MTMGTRLACMSAGEYPSRILPASLFTGNVLGLLRRHGSCAARSLCDQASERAIAGELRMECRMRLRTMIQRPQPLPALAVSRRHRVDLRLDLLLVDREAQVRRDRVEEQLRPHLMLGARSQLGAKLGQGTLAIGPLRKTDAECPEERLDATFHERRRHVEGMPSDHLLEEPLVHRVGGTRL